MATSPAKMNVHPQAAQLGPLLREERRTDVAVLLVEPVRGGAVHYADPKSIEDHERLARDLTSGIEECNAFTAAGNALGDPIRLPEEVRWRMGRVFDVSYTHGVDVRVTLRDRQGNGHVMKMGPRLLHAMTGGDLADAPSVWRAVPGIGPVPTTLVRSVAVAIRYGLLKRREERHDLIHSLQLRADDKRLRENPTANEQ
jgi:hypothetical protein